MPLPAELSCDSVRDRLDPLLDGDLGQIDEAAVRQHLDACAACREELQLAHKLRDALRSGLPALTCPPAVTAEVLRVAREEALGAPAQRRTSAPVAARPAWWDRLHAWLAVRPAASPVASWVAVAALLLIVAAVPFIVRTVLSPERSGSATQATQTTRPALPAPSTGSTGSPAAESPEYTPEQIARAERQARLVLAAVAQVSRGAGRTVRDQVFEQALMRPARHAVESLEQIDAPADRQRRQP